MGRIGCTSAGNQNESRFSEPMPWIGMYVALASAACAMAMAVDALHGLRYRKLWFPCKFFSFNATTLTLVGVAIKLSVDLNTSMPRQHDQLAKLSSAVFICTVMGNSMPSFGKMENTEIFVNIIALGILVVTAIVNTCIQLVTGVIYVFWKEHIFVMFLMLVLLTISCSSALATPSTKGYLNKKFRKKHKEAVKECLDRTDVAASTKLKEGIKKYWMMAYTGSPQFVMGHSPTCIASGAFCLLSAAILAEALLRSHLMPQSFKFCSGESDYKWSTTLVLVTQTVAVAVGTFAPVVRWFMAINFRCPKKAIKLYFKVEKYWIWVLLELKEYPLTSIISSRRGRRFAHKAKSQILGFGIHLQIMIVMMSKLIQLLSIFCVGRSLILYTWIKKMKCSSHDIETQLNQNPNLDLTLARYVIHLEGEEAMVDLVMRNNCNATDCWIKLGEKQQPKYLIKFLEKFNSSQGYRGVIEFDKDQVPSLDSEEPPNCWALPIATLTCIAVSLRGMENCLVMQLINSVNEGLILVKVVENNLNTKQEFVNLCKAAETVWQGVDLYHKWLNVDLHQLKGKPAKALAANSMYRIAQSVVLDYENRELSNERVFENLCLMISDILSACFTNLGHVMLLMCHCNSIEHREESVRRATLLLGKTCKILKSIQGKQLPASDPDQLLYIDYWRLSMKQNQT